jgi:acid stress-induced BolA-like protein IbaG/YrbA
MTDKLKRRLNQPFDDYELILLDHIAKAQGDAAEYAQKAQDETMTDQVALHSYINHMEAIARSRAYYNALYEYRQLKRLHAVLLPLPQKDQREELAEVN